MDAFVTQHAVGLAHLPTVDQVAAGIAYADAICAGPVVESVRTAGL